MNDFMLIAEAAEYLRIAPATLYGWVHQRKIPFRKHGGRLVLFRPDLDEWSRCQNIEILSQESFSTFKKYVKNRGLPRSGRSLKTEQNAVESSIPKPRG